ncbi:hypothetical protein AAC387_Pa01g2222 [Persea americana]
MPTCRPFSLQTQSKVPTLLPAESPATQLLFLVSGQSTCTLANGHPPVLRPAAIPIYLPSGQHLHTLRPAATHSSSSWPAASPPAPLPVATLLHSASSHLFFFLFILFQSASPAAFSLLLSASSPPCCCQPALTPANSANHPLAQPATSSS